MLIKGYLILAATLLAVTSNTIAQSNTSKLNYFLDACDAVFKMPRGFSEIPLPSSDRISQFAIKDSTTKFEVRYSIMPYKLAFPDDVNSLDTMTFTRFDSAIRMYAKGIPKGMKYITPFFTDGTLKKEFGADKGWFCHFYPKPEFGGDFVFCQASVMRKDGVGEYYIFQLFSDTGHETQVNLSNVLSSIKFKP